MALAELQQARSRGSILAANRHVAMGVDRGAEAALGPAVIPRHMHALPSRHIGMRVPFFWKLRLHAHLPTRGTGLGTRRPQGPQRGSRRAGRVDGQVPSHPGIRWPSRIGKRGTHQQCTCHPRSGQPLGS